MAEVVWSAPAIADLEAITDFISLDNPAAAARLVADILRHVRLLADHPRAGRRPPELGRSSRYREIIEPPCRVFCRVEPARIVVLHVMRSERVLRPRRLREKQR